MIELLILFMFILLMILFGTIYFYIQLTKYLIEKVNNHKAKLGIKAMSVVIAYLILLLVFCFIAVNEMGNFFDGCRIVLYGFYCFIYFLIALKDGFPISLRDTTDFLFWLYVLFGMVTYFTIIFIIHYYLIKLITKRKKLITILLILINFFIIVSYLFFEASILGFATV
ncbi:hypothetical protein LCL95_07535 [Bacillus timonensis]|nr:hypothetical protein [Bacillus timonensis]